MTVSKEEYERAKKIVVDYEYEQYMNEMSDSFDDDDMGEFDEDDERDRQAEEDFERASSCTCGAWVVNNRGQGVHIADCFCGAD